MEEFYSWKMKGLAKGVDPLIIVDELRRIRELRGKLTAELIVIEAQADDSILHSLFEWDDAKAAYGYRLQQARILLNNINIRVISDGEPREVSVFEVVSNKGEYKPINTFTKDDIAFIKSNTVSQLTYLKNKLRVYNDFNKVIPHIEQAIQCLN